MRNESKRTSRPSWGMLAHSLPVEQLFHLGSSKLVEPGEA